MRNFAFAVIAFISGCASTGTPRDPLCAEIVRFANATNEGTQRRIELCTDWGDRCADASASSSRMIFSSASCTAGGYEPGDRLCEYLVEHMQREFPSNNFSSALACLAPYSPERYGDYEWERAAVRSEKMSGLNEGVGVGVEFARGSDQGPATLRIDAKAALPSFPFDVVRTRLGKDVVSVTGVGDCSATPALPMLNDAAFATTYPNGAFVVCDAKVVRDRATATILQYLFDAARNTVLAASSIDVQIAKHGSNWRVSEWRKTAIDSVP